MTPCIELMHLPLVQPSTDEGSWTLTIVVIVALIACSLVLIMLIGYFVIVLVGHPAAASTTTQSRKFLAQEVRIVRPGLSDRSPGAARRRACARRQRRYGDAPENCSARHGRNRRPPGSPRASCSPAADTASTSNAPSTCAEPYSTVCPMCRADLRTEAQRRRCRRSPSPRPRPASKSAPGSRCA